MADNFDQNKKDILDSSSALGRFNEALRDSIDLSKQLSKNVESLPSSLNLSSSMNKRLVQDMDQYNQSLSETSKLTRKALEGKIKIKDVEKELKTLAEDYEKYQRNNEASFGRQGRFIRAQRDIKREIAALEQREIERREKIIAADLNIDRINQQIAHHQNVAQTTMSATQKKLAKEEIKALKERRSEEEATIAYMERVSKNAEKELTEKLKTKQALDDIVSQHKEIGDNYEREIENNKILIQTLKEQTILGKLQSKNISKFNEGLQESLGALSKLGSFFSPLVNFAFKISDQTTKLQKNLVLSREEARDLRQDFNNMAVASDDIAVNTSRLVEANLALGQQLGFNSKFTSDLNIQFIKLTKQIGLSEEAAGGLAKLSIATGSTLEEAKNVSLETSQALSSQYGIQLNQREVLEEIGKVSGQTLAMFKANPKLLAEAVAQAKLLGTSLETTKKQASSLLNFEQSIENELQAELLTGQQFNLERARSAALTGDMTTAMKELANQNLDFNKYSNMNVIAQDKVAASLGLSSDELSNQLLKQQYLGKSREEIAALAGDEVANRIEALNAQDKFNLATEKMQDIIGKLVGGPLGTLVDMMASLADNSLVLYSTLGLMAGLSFTKLVVGLAASAVQAGLLAAGTAASMSALTLGVGAIAIAAGIATMMAAYSSAKEEATKTGDMFSSKGKTIVSPKEGGLFELSDNDEFAAAPGLSSMIGNNKQTIVTQDNSALLEELKALRSEMAGAKDGINKLNDKKGVVTIDGQKAGTAQMMGNYNLA